MKISNLIYQINKEIIWKVILFQSQLIRWVLSQICFEISV